MSLVALGVLGTGYLPSARALVSPYKGPGLAAAGEWVRERWVGRDPCDCSLVSHIVSGSRRRAPGIPLTAVILQYIGAGSPMTQHV